ncbi:MULTISPECIES: peptide-methionine (S)-S-oxide reductase MsrA [unclassified Pantoea]|uniref:peptide-methionine (S)-S-oxide reductase MsrA n=1 Tax=unclassified Pantoea TaxID=2630326 RepID=UPI001CD648C7|nr:MULTISPECIES: peptide-methionine (S)-S-oxide reductase MsrA [unclassified Pantoea]MCA1177604.1 peptide-methionine (S)-S-oxide reductase MsrA [Pantoea sp. alder69]MCA1249490.1 peptide-methionine (S)-S-oxide reductase MsrA [Pantoea sp. alder70]MCA1266093.1 peptide-methionine (S)-S-oxide reductase MsrA [Pantoea sp. alder81]
MMREQAIFAGGCFWCTEAIFQSIHGVLSVESGYIGGHVASPTYDQVYSDTTGHAEAVKIEFDPTLVSYDDLLDIHFATHDATQENIKEGVVRSRYRSALFPTSDAQRIAAEQGIARAAAELDKALVTKLEPLAEWYAAEDYHQNFWEKEGQENAFCMMNIPAKLKKLRNKFPEQASNS